MDQSLTNLFAKYQNNLAFSSHPRITSVHDVGTMDETLLNLAVINQAREDVLLLIQYGVDVNKQGEMGFTPVQNACFNGNVAILEILLANGANPNIKNELGNQAEDFVTDERHGKKKAKEMMALLKYYKNHHSK
jgi:putative ankyrin-repeat harboring protein